MGGRRQAACGRRSLARAPPWAAPVLLTAAAIGGSKQGPAVGGDLQGGLQGGQDGVLCPGGVGSSLRPNG
jgi:hypothetical protein